MKKRRGLRTYVHPNNTKVQLDYIFINKKLINSIVNCKVYSSFEGVSFGHRIVWANIRLCLNKNKKQAVKTTRYELSSLINWDISNEYSVTVRSKFDSLLETSEIYILNDKSENFVITHMEATAECIPTKPKTKWRILSKSTNS